MGYVQKGLITPAPHSSWLPSSPWACPVRTQEGRLALDPTRKGRKDCAAAVRVRVGLDRDGQMPCVCVCCARVCSVCMTLVLVLLIEVSE